MNRTGYFLASLSLTACIADSKPLGSGEEDEGDASSADGQDDEGNGSATSSGGSGATSGGTTATTDTATSTTDTSNPTATSNPTVSSTSDTAGEDTTTDTDTDDGPGTDTSETACEDFEQTIADAAAMSKTPPVDCGLLSLSDPLADWQDAQQCVLLRSGQEESFQVIYEVQGIDSFPAMAFVGVQGFVYGLSEYHHDEGGLSGGAFTGRRDCSSIALVADCEVTPGELCLSCVDGGNTFDEVCSDQV